MYHKSRARSSSVDQSRIPKLSKRSNSSSKDVEVRPMVPHSKQSLASSSRQQGSTCYSASNSRMKGAKESMKDPRPISDKLFQEKARHELMRFLCDNEFPFEISTKILTNPSNLDFRRIVEFMCKWFCLPDDFTLGQKLEESIPDLMDLLRYPVVVPKRVFQMVGASHNWPTLLAFLDWLRVVAESENDLYDKIIEDFPFSKSAYHRYLMKTYSLFMQGKDDFSGEFAELKDELVKHRDIKKENEELKKNLEKLEEEEAAMLQAKLNSEKMLSSWEAEVKKLTKDREDVLAATEQRSSFYLQQQKSFENCKIQIEKLDAEISQKTMEVESREEEVEQQGRLSFDVHKLDSEFKNVIGRVSDAAKLIESLKLTKESVQSEFTEHEEQTKSLMFNVRESLMNCNYLTREEDDIVFRVKPQLDQNICDIKNLMDEQLMPRVTKERQELAESCDNPELNKLKETFPMLEKETQHLTNVIKAIDRDIRNTDEFHTHRVEEKLEELNKYQDVIVQKRMEVKERSEENLLLMDNVSKLEAKREEMREKWLQRTSERADSARKYMLTAQTIIQLGEQIMEEDAERIKEEFIKLTSAKKNEG